MSSFSFPLIFDDENQKKIALTLLEKSNIESRPLISGNLLRHPAFSKYKGNASFKNADKLHACALYLGNHQFVTKQNLKVLDKVLEEVVSSANH